MFKFLKYWAIAFCTCFTCVAVAQSLNANNDTIAQVAKPNMQAYEALHLPALRNIKTARPIIVAIVDDGFSFTHRDCKNYYYRNNNEIPGNAIDDDKNGYKDDICGWDVADDDKDVSIPVGREEMFYHGTMVMSIVTRVAEKCFGPMAYNYIKILPVKALSDKADKANMEAGYDGIIYAVHMNADIIICAWSGGKYDREKYRAVFNEAANKGIIIIGSAGNFYSEQTDPPASLSNVYAVAAIDSALRKIKSSNYGSKVDLVANGDKVYAAYPTKNNTYFYGDGTSSAVSLIGGCVAVLKVLAPKAQPEEIIGALKNTASPVDSVNRYYAGKLGAGAPDLTAAADYLLHKQNRYNYFNAKRPVGELLLDKYSKQNSWQVNPIGGFTSIVFTLGGKAISSKDYLSFFIKDSLFAQYPLVEFPNSVVVPGSNVKVAYTGRHAEGLHLNYTSIPVDSTKLYCTGTKYYEQPTGEIADGSGTANYANNCACKWQIKVAPGKHVRLEFDEFDTQAKIDNVYIYQGTETLEENLIARFSGPTLPPVVTSASNEVLIWFVTDGTVTGKGWHLRYTTTDDAPGSSPPAR